MKLIFLFLIIVFYISSAFAQNNYPIQYLKNSSSNAKFVLKNNNKISANSSFLIADLYKKNKLKDKSVTDSSLIKKYRLTNIDSVLYISCFIEVKDINALNTLTEKGIKVKSASKNIITALVPISIFNDISNIENINYVEISESVKIKMDKVRTETGVNNVYNAVNLPKSYTGKDVIIGVIDNGIDLTHPNFYDTNYYYTRIKRAWDQDGTGGKPPKGYNYGVELSSQNEMLNYKSDDTTTSHASHVIGIASGSGYGSNNKYRGIAPCSDLVFVSFVDNSGIADGIDYIINYAKLYDLPCVINMSLGMHYGPHDGTSMFDQFCDGKVGEGLILVGSAGNEGADKIFIDKTFNSTDTVVSTFVRFPYSTVKSSGQTSLDIWGEQGGSFKVSVKIYNTNTNQVEDYTPSITPNSQSSFNNFDLYDSDTYSDICSVDISTEINSQNNKPHAYIELNNLGQSDNYQWVMIEIIGKNTNVKMWEVDNAAEFSNNSKPLPWVSGTSNSTVTEIGGTGKNIITVGAYTTKTNWIDIFGNTQFADYPGVVGQIASFSSKGPTADNRVKPDITAPGNVIASSFNSYCWEDATYVVDQVEMGGKTWYYGVMQGTSMAAPVVTGVIALWLQANPFLTPDEVKGLLKSGAIKDTYTGTIGDEGSNTWGYGKINANVFDQITFVQSDIRIYPRYFRGIVNVRFDKAYSNAEFNVYDLYGRKVYNGKVSDIQSGQIEHLYMTNLSMGYYTLRLNIDGNISNTKLIMLK